MTEHTGPLSVDDLRSAIWSGRISPLYQPVVRIADRRLAGFEALARLDHPTRGTLLPSLFVPQIEAAGLAWTLTEAVIRRVFDDWRDGLLETMDVWVAVNVPLDVMLDAGALAWFERTRLAAGIAAERVMIELTESLAVTRVDVLGRAIRQLRGLGYRLTIDDVGPAMRDHRALLALPFSGLKLDMSVVRGDGRDEAFLRETIEAARAAGLTITAEGVETEVIWDRMAALGVGTAQGFLIGRPLPIEAVGAWYEDWNGRNGPRDR